MEERAMSRPDWVPAEVDLDRPNAARMYDYYLGGSHNMRVDREFAEQAIAVVPKLPLIAQQNRAFLRRAVGYCLDAGIRQFLDIGSGIPTVGNVHELAQQSHPDTRVIYVDSDRVAIAHAKAILDGDDRADAILGDVRQPADLLAHPDLRRLIDPAEPLAVLLVAVLHFVLPPDDPADLIDRLIDPAAPGSHVVISHGTSEAPDQAHPFSAVYRHTSTPITSRPRAEIAAFFRSLELVPPGLVWLPDWRPDEPRDMAEPGGWTQILAGVGRKP
jgi:hypothetical protein